MFEARRAAQILATELGFNEAEVGKVAIVATEAATNLVKHAKGGQIVMRKSSPETLDIAVLDKGPGIEDIDACLRDGYSSVGTMGGGLGAIQRLAGQSEFYTLLGKGTAVFIRCSRANGMRHLDIDGMSVPLRASCLRRMHGLPFRTNAGAPSAWQMGWGMAGCGKGVAYCD